MKNNSWTKQCSFPPGTLVSGKWHRQHYTIIRQLGSGANGVVYLAKGKDGYVALKMSGDSMSIISEVNVLKAFSKVQGPVLGPSLLDVDDWERGGKKTIPFYVMEYIEGPVLLAFVRDKGRHWAGILIIQLLDILEQMHRQGWTFGDLKPENLIVSHPRTRIRCIDVGGTTKMGRSIKEFTEFFDRGYWGLGSRKAEPSYDIFSTAMLMINVYYPSRFTRKGSGLDQLKEMIKKEPELRCFEPVLIKALEGKYRNAGDMKNELLGRLSFRNSRSQKHSAKKRQGQGRKGSLHETAGVLLVTSFLYGLYIYLFLL
ncbi:serine/threonine-protein kinase [Siminovitchia fortis]|uniref:Protein kinase family protein n=1 Tax=Siminovitchia fortis TaxID=254758 RepID=A0A443IJR5_9BACI|nr:serine/threonine-protein kinase [Siminovitchia fortis]RWR04721.1 protein kinase family protein [Siminovitchia fortis]WHY81318.1 serine/threonine-protein kinase [Siminovitchia fortis]